MPSSAPLLAYARATEQAWILGGRMATHSERLSSIAEARAKGAAEMVQLLVDDDPFYQPPGGAKDVALGHRGGCSSG